MADDDDLDPLVTQCPNCDTRFRVTENQLQVAQGQVRCGACLTVFDGTSSLLMDGDLLAADFLDEDVDALLSEIDAQAQAPEAVPPMMELSAVEDDLEQQLEEQDEAAALDALEAELMAELKGDEPPPRRAAPPPDNASPGPHAPQPGSQQADATPSDAKPSDAKPPDVKPAETPPSEDSDEQHSEETERLLSALDELDLDDDPLANAPRNAEPAGITVPPATADGDATPVPSPAEAQSAPNPLPDIPVSAAYEISPELFQDEPKPRRWTSWIVLAIALIALPAQVMWYQFDEWGKDARLRPVYQVACDVLGCELPIRRDVGLIVARNSVLRDHPDVVGALIYDALLVNEASYAQPFPLVELTLTTVRGQLVASRRFRPAEYLSGEASDLNQMPTRTPIHIALEIKDPGEAPLNFRVRFLPFD